MDPVKDLSEWHPWRPRTWFHRDRLRLEGTPLIRIKRLAGDLRMRRRRLDVYRTSPSWPGKAQAWQFELRRYDNQLLVAAEMLEVTGLDPPSRIPLTPEERAVLEDRLALAGLDVFADITRPSGDVFEDE
ncbi:MAG: hypothetical protein ACR2HV_06490 [Acidimicrobiales bacterium]